ncbi:MAG: hypothetical protein PWQ97_439 [Tepidanaerobacteraceae bacterium]|nr:hypothetical protein [Tepidanaerobacteraceae bacterium]
MDITYLAPIWYIEIEGYKLNKIIRFVVNSSYKDPIDTADIEIQYQPELASVFSDGMSATIYMGYREQGLALVFKGNITKINRDKIITIHCQNQARLLKKSLIRAFYNIKPDSVIKWCLAQVGISDADVYSGLPPFARFIANGTGIEIFKKVANTWSLKDWCYYIEPEDQFYWGPIAQSPRAKTDPFIFEAPGNIISHEAKDGYGIIEARSTPNIRPLNLINVIDKRYWSNYKTLRVSKVKYLQDQTKARTYIEWESQEMSS